MQFWIVVNRFADLDESATQTAVIVMELVLGAMVGALYQAVPGPVAAIVPTVEFPFGTPLTAQFTVVSGCPALFTLARSWTVPPGNTNDMPEGFVDTFSATSLVMVRAAWPLAELSAWLVAWIVTFAGLGKTLGAV